MDRREQIRTAAEKASRGVGGNWEHIRKGAELWFIRGAIWADSHPKWIPVEERLPEEGQVVLIYTKGGSVSTACYTDSRFDITELLKAINVTHWMKIVPPKKEE